MLDFPSPMIPYTVYVSCKTYNQSEYILEAMNGFCIQKTNFPFICAIFDDASTDGEQKVIRKYIDDNFELFEESASYQTETDYAYISYARHKINTNCHFVVFYLKNNHYSNPQKYAGKKEEYVKDWMCDCKYEAICEGDDYWTDEYKLQKQVDWLENHPDYGMVYTDFDILRNGVIYKSSGVNRSDGDIFYTLLVEDNFIATLTTCYRKSLLSQIDTDYPSSFKMGDLPLWIQIARISKIKYLNESTSVYRRLDDSASHSVDFNRQMSFARNALEVQRYYAEKFNVLQALPIIDANIAKNKVVLALYNLDIYGFCNLIRGVCIDLSDIMKVLKAWRDKFAMLL